MPSVLLRRASFFTPSLLLHAERPSLPSFLLRRASFFKPCLICRAPYVSPSITLTMRFLPAVHRTARRARYIKRPSCCQASYIPPGVFPSVPCGGCRQSQSRAAAFCWSATQRCFLLFIHVYLIVLRGLFTYAMPIDGCRSVAGIVRVL